MVCLYYSWYRVTEAALEAWFVCIIVGTESMMYHWQWCMDSWYRVTEITTGLMIKRSSIGPQHFLYGTSRS